MAYAISIMLMLVLMQLVSVYREFRELSIYSFYINRYCYYSSCNAKKQGCSNAVGNQKRHRKNLTEKKGFSRLTDPGSKIISKEIS